ncbi:MAG: hypothetical protein ABIO35_08225 [Nitrobacter sp.]
MQPNIAVGEPVRWLLIFSRQAASRWMSFIAFGRFKHVRAIGYVPGFDQWIFYDVRWSACHLFVVRDKTDEFRALFSDWAYDAEIVSMDRPARSLSRLPKTFLCTTAIGHLLGLRCVAARPDAFYRQCLSHGGVVIDGRAQETRTAADEPAVRPACSAGGAG